MLDFISICHSFTVELDLSLDTSKLGTAYHHTLHKHYYWSTYRELTGYADAVKSALPDEINLKFYWFFL